MSESTLSLAQLSKAIKYLIYIDRTASAILRQPLTIDQDGTIVPLPLNPISNRFYLMIDDKTDNKPFLGIFNDVSHSVDGVDALTLTLVFPGYQYNKWGTWNVIDLAVNPSSQYSIDAFMNRNLLRFGDDLHKYIRYITLKRPMQTKIRVAGHSYGGAIAQSVALIYGHIIAYHKNYRISMFTTRFVEALYEQHLSQYVTNEIMTALSVGPDASPSSQFAYLVLQYLRDNDLDPFNHEHMMSAIIATDKDIFQRMSVEEVFSFAAPTVFCQNVYEHYNAFKSSANDVAMIDRTYNFCLSSDPIAGILNTRSLFGIFVSVLSGFRARYQAGQIVYMQDGTFNSTHEYEHYYNFITAALNTGTEFPVADGQNCKVNPLPIAQILLALPKIYRTYGIVDAAILFLIYLVAQAVLWGTIFLGIRALWFGFRFARQEPLPWSSLISIWTW